MNKQRTLFSIIFCHLDLDCHLDFGILVVLCSLLAAGNTDTHLDERSSHHFVSIIQIRYELYYLQQGGVGIRMLDQRLVGRSSR
jgi:hypothetical protein